MTSQAEHPTPPYVGIASEKGPNRRRNADAAELHRWRGRLAAAVVDGTGSTPEVAEFAQHAAYHGVRVAARRSPMLAILAVAEAVADPLEGLPSPDGAMIVAVAEPGEPWYLAWTGDCKAYAWDGTDLHCITTAHTLGQMMRDSGEDEDTARRHDNHLYHSISRATISSVPTATSPHRLVVLVSDGVKLSEDLLQNIVAKHAAEPTVCAQELVAAARAAGSGDDATALVAAHPYID